MDLLIVVFLGACTGWLAGGLIKQGGLGTIVDIFGGALGGVGASYIFPAIGVFNTEGLVGLGISAALGGIAIALLLHLAISD